MAMKFETNNWNIITLNVVVVYKCNNKEGKSRMLMHLMWFSFLFLLHIEKVHGTESNNIINRMSIIGVIHIDQIKFKLHKRGCF